eukprot:9177913-Prorocentrum_lima.AAC.1
MGLNGKPDVRQHTLEKQKHAWLKHLLLQSSQDSSHFSLKLGEAFRVLQGSKQSIFRRNPEIRSRLCYSQFCKILRRGRLGYVKGGRRLDMCAICLHWDKNVCPQHKRLLSQ